MKNLKELAMRKAAEVKSALVSKEAANNSTEVVIIILVTVVIAVAVGVAVKKLILDGDGSILDNIKTKLSEASTLNG